MGMFMASLTFRCDNPAIWADLKPKLHNAAEQLPGLVHNLNADGPGYVLLSPYGDLGSSLGEMAEDVSRLCGGYAVMAMCIDSDFNMMELYHCGELVERSCIGECYYDLPEEVAPPKPENWEPLLLDPTQTEALSNVLLGDEVFAEDSLRKLSALTGLPIFDDQLMFGNC